MWYEVYEIRKCETKNRIDSQTMTLEICDTLTEAKENYTKRLKTGKWTNKTLGIDKWENKNNPVSLGSVI